MASAFDKYLKILGIGQKSPEQQERDASPVLTAMFNRRAPSYDEIEEQKKLNREAGVWFPHFDGRRGLKEGERLTNYRGITYLVPAGIDVPESIQSPEQIPQPPTPPQAGSAARPPRREITPPAPAERERPLDVLSFRESPNFPARLPSMDVPVPTRPDFSPQRSNMPPPGPGLLQPPTGMPQMPQPPKPDMDSTIDNLMARYEGMYGEPPVAPPPQQPVPQELGLPTFTTPGYFPEGMLAPQRPDIQSPILPEDKPDMFRGQLPVPAMPEYDYGALVKRGALQTGRASDEELDAYFDYLLSQDPYYGGN